MTDPKPQPPEERPFKVRQLIAALADALSANAAKTGGRPSVHLTVGADGRCWAKASTGVRGKAQRAKPGADLRDFWDEEMTVPTLEECW